MLRLLRLLLLLLLLLLRVNLLHVLFVLERGREDGGGGSCSTVGHGCVGEEGDVGVGGCQRRGERRRHAVLVVGKRVVEEERRV